MIQTLDRASVLPFFTPNSPEWSTVLAEWDKCPKWSLDVETFGSNSGDGLNPWKGDIRLIQIGLPNGKVLMVDLGHSADRRPLPEPFGSLLKRKLRDPHDQKLGHNLKFDLLWLAVKFGFKGRSLRDTMLASEVIWAGLRCKHGLKAVAERLGLEVDKTEQTSDWGATDLTHAQLEYAAKDARIVHQIWNTLWAKACGEGVEKQIRGECGALPAFVEMELTGMPADRTELESMLIRYQEAAEDALKPFHDELTLDLIHGDSGQPTLFDFADCGITPERLNPDSSQQVTAALNKKYGLNLKGSNQGDLAAHWDKPAVRAISLYRTLRTCVAYIEGCLEAHFDGAVRGSYDQIGPTGFGRSTCGDDRSSSRRCVNLQNPPGRLPAALARYNLPAIRSAFKAPEGRCLLISDLSQAHARIAADASQDSTLLAAYKEGIDAHCVTAANLAKLNGLGDDWTVENLAKWRKDKQHPNHETAVRLRDVSKNVLYGSLNGQGWATLQKTAETQGVAMSESEAKNGIKAFKHTYSGLHNFQQNIVCEANKTCKTFPWIDSEKMPHGFCQLRGGSGRRIFMPKFPSDFRPQPSVKLSDACAHYWTSCEADIVKLAMVGFVAECDRHPEWEAVIVNMCHDEVDVTCNSEHALACAKALQTSMRGGMRLFIKSIPVDEEAGPESLIVKSWADK